jgi:hypothetical protein
VHVFKDTDFELCAMFGEEPEDAAPPHSEGLIRPIGLSEAELAANPEQLRQLIVAELLSAHSLSRWLGNGGIESWKRHTNGEDDPWYRAVQSLEYHYRRSVFLYKELERRL